MSYQVTFISEDALPAGQDWAATKCDGRCVLFVKPSCCRGGYIPARAARAIWSLVGRSPSAELLATPELALSSR